MGLATKWLDPINRDAFCFILSQMQSDERFLIFGCDDTKLSSLMSLNLRYEQMKK